jgi:6-phosphofructokinase 1
MKAGILTGGGDCPGMNAFIRAVTRSLINMQPDVEVWGILDGWAGMIEQSYRRLTVADTVGINNLGGTILGTVRVPEMRTDPELRRKVMLNYIDAGFDILFVCGGNGSLHASHGLDLLLREAGYRSPIYVTAGSIDNDVANSYGTSIGFYSAIQRSLEMLGWIRDTASSHRRVYLIESMGRDSAFLPFYSGIVAGVEYVIRPDEEVDFEALVDMIERRDRDTRIIVSEAYSKSLDEIEAILQDALDRRRSRHDIRTVNMGYFQRGGEPSISDVLRANWLGFNMVKAMLAGEESSFFGAKHVTDPPVRLPLAAALQPSANLDDIPRDMIEMALALR